MTNPVSSPREKIVMHVDTSELPSVSSSPAEQRLLDRAVFIARKICALRQENESLLMHYALIEEET